MDPYPSSLTFEGIRHSRMLLAGIQGNGSWTPDQNIRGHFLGLVSTPNSPNF
jgi:hypothetical protein